ncbi:hypothetical protein DFH09DRAFT_291012 [Mycena vulgaris]|nr:hypothetical protein DFH09DRAFT_291012 [Mycena vulgaris]
MDVSSLRTEIKGWERSFKATHGRDPSVQDIKEQPNLAQKYRLYKKLTKGSEPAPSNKPSNPPSTPPKSQSRDSTHPSLLLSQPRAISTAQPLSGYNPFSPQKNKGKQKELSFDAHSKTNPFRLTRDPSPDPVPRISFPSSSAATGDPFAPTPNNAVSRARKRLRGEPVSPSPNKEKRRRMVSPHGDSEDEDEDLSAANTSFIDDSPVKPPNGVRSFKLLFDETAAKPKFPLLRSKTLFGERALGAEGSESMDVDDVPPRSTEEPSTTNSSIGQAPIGDPFSESVEGGTASLSDEYISDDRPSQKATVAARNLLAPSPPPANQRSSGKPHPHNGKGRGKPIGEGQKKMAPGSPDDGDDGSDEDNEMNENGQHKIRLLDRTRGRAREDNAIDEDTYHLMARRPSEAMPQPQTSESISLPDALLSILSLAPTSTHGHRDDHVVEELLYGTRRRNYDPSKGGEIWGVGELEEEERDEFALNDGPRGSAREAYDDEDDWEGEGVPWEVGEL